MIWTGKKRLPVKVTGRIIPFHSMVGTRTADYYASVGYIGEKGYTTNSDFKRWNGRVNANARLSSRIKAGVECVWFHYYN